MKVYYTDLFHIPLPKNHRFPILKYQLLRENIEKWVRENNKSDSIELLQPTAAAENDIILAHDLDYFKRFKDGALSDKDIRRLGLPWSLALVERSLRSVGGTISACQSALLDGVSMYLGGGTHHAGRSHGEGFCVFNDVVIASRVLQRDSTIKKVLIIDCDVHQGNGTAAITRGDKTIFTFSIHGQKNFPFRKSPSDLDIGLPDGTEDTEYLDLLEEGVIRSLALANPDFTIFLAGADPYKGDALGRLNISKDALKRRDEIVIEICGEKKLPTAVVLSGGYGKNIQDTVEIHFQTFKVLAGIKKQASGFLAC